MAKPKKMLLTFEWPNCPSDDGKWIWRSRQDVVTVIGTVGKYAIVRYRREHPFVVETKELSELP